MIRNRNRLAAFLTLNLSLLCAAEAQAAWQNNAFGSDISLKGDLYTPGTPATAPAILVALHYCTGHSSAVQGWFQSAADKNGFYIIAPDAGKQCFDASASRAGDPAAIVKMVDWVVKNKNADKTRVFAAGLSSGGCMTNTLLAIYPDVFAGGAAMPGFTAGGWPAGDITCTKCGSSPPAGDGKFWGDKARAAFAWTGTYGCSQQWVGGGDEFNFNGWLPAVASQFQDLGKLGAGTAGSGAPSGWTRTEYKDAAGNVRLQTNLGPTSQKHDLTGVGNSTIFANVITFLGLDKPTGACGLSTTSTMGGSSGIGGAGGGSAGGSASTGGTFSTAGGAATGGVTNTGGMPGSSGGAPQAGTGSATGGKPTAPTGGNTSSAGQPATAGAPSGAGGSTGSTTAGTANGAGAPPDDAIGCACIAAGHSTRASFAGLLAVGLGALLARRRRR